MTELTAIEIEDIVVLLGGALVAEMTDSLPQMPAYWTTSLARPTHEQMLRLTFIKGLVDEVGSSMDDQSLREWLVGVDGELGMPPSRAIRHAAFEQVRQASSRVVSGSRS